MQNVEFYKHTLGSIEVEHLHETLNSRFLTTGPTTNEFEDRFARFVGTTNSIGVSSCTMGLFITLRALGIGEGDEVITTPATFIATANAVLYCGATPVFVDVEPDTGNIDTKKIEDAITSKTRAIIPVHLYGLMCDMRAISEIAKRHNLRIIEDSAHCVEGMRDGVRPGELSDAAVFSFYATKNLTSGEGGAIATNDKGLNDALKRYRLHGMSAGAGERYTEEYRHWDMDFLGYKCNMSDIQAALLLPQLEVLRDRLGEREVIASRYESAFSADSRLGFPQSMPGTIHARHLSTIWVGPDIRDSMLRWLQENGVGVGVHFRAVHLLEYYRQQFEYRPGAYPIAERIGASTLSLPLYPSLGAEEQEYVIKTVLDGLDHLS
jgi:UDP-4-amino-4-deoxy-L-arabinose-oxoglutarate aminotransferase